VVIELNLLASLNKTETRSLDAAIERYSGFLGMSAKVIS
jgi:hypothetical protein